MRLDRSAIRLRPRKNWEAMDLGFSMARHWFWPLWLLWIALALPIYALLLLVFYEHPVMASVIFWWLKPAFEPLLVDWLGKSLFGESLLVRDQLKKVFTVVPRMLLMNLTWGRLSTSRSYNMAVQQLERVKGKAYRLRLRTLYLTAPKSAWLTILCLHFEAALEYSAIALLGFLMPVDWQLEFFSLQSFDQSWFDWLACVFYFFGVSIVAPFYVSAGFSLYINSRTHLEAWDIEVAFRAMVQERQAAHQPVHTHVAGLVLVVLVPLWCSLTPSNAWAAQPDQAKANIEQILKHEDFGRTEMATAWRWKNADKKDDPDWSGFDLSGFTGFFRLLGQLLELLAWIAVGSVIFWIVKQLAPRLGRWDLHWQRKKNTNQTEFQKISFQVEAEQLPDDPIAAVLALLKRSQYRKSIALLYRLTLKHYVEIFHIEIPDSATEAECLRIIRRKRPDNESIFFQKLTRYWQRVAYADQVPSAELIRELCQDWGRYYAGDG